MPIVSVASETRICHVLFVLEGIFILLDVVVAVPEVLHEVLFGVQPIDIDHILRVAFLFVE